MRKIKQMNKKKGFLYLLKSYYIHGKKIIYIELLLALFTPIQTLIAYLLQKDIIDLVLISGRNKTSMIKIIIYYFVVTSIIAIISSFCYTKLLPNLNLKVNAKLTLDIYKQARSTDLSHYDDAEFFDNYTWTLSEYVKRCRESKDIFIGLIKCLLNTISLLTLIATSSPFVVIIVLSVVILNTILNNFQKKVQVKNDADTLPIRRKQNYISRIFYLKDYAEDMRIYPLGNMLQEKFNKNITDQCDIYDKYQNKYFIISFLKNLCVCISTIGTFTYLGFLLLSSRITPGNFSASYTSSLSLKNSLLSIFEYFVKAKTIAIYSEKINNFFSVNNDIENNGGNRLLLEAPIYNLTINNLSFSYFHSQPTLKNLNLEIGENEKIAIIGANGSGKSTLTKLLLRLYNPTHGEIKINGIDLAKLDVHWYRKNVRFVSMSSMLYAYSLKDNIQMGDETSIVNLEENNLFLSPILKKLNDNMEVNLTKEFDNDGIILSSGESQLVKLERALSKSAFISILDEPCTNLDKAREKMVIEKILKSPGIVILITHNLFSIEKMDKIVFLKNGVITEIGSHAQLMQLKGDYFSLYISQFNKDD